MNPHMVYQKQLEAMYNWWSEVLSKPADTKSATATPKHSSDYAVSPQASFAKYAVTFKPFAFASIFTGIWNFFRPGGTSTAGESKEAKYEADPFTTMNCYGDRVY